MRNKTVYGIGLNAGDELTGNKYIASIEGHRSAHRFAVIKQKHTTIETRIRLDDNQPYAVPMWHPAPYRRYIIGVVTHIETIGHTVYGNPIKKVEIRHIDGSYQSFRISDNAGLVYAIGNGEYRENMHYFELTKANRISGRIKRF